MVSGNSFREHRQQQSYQIAGNGSSKATMTKPVFGAGALDSRSMPTSIGNNQKIFTSDKTAQQVHSNPSTGQPGLNFMRQATQRTFIPYRQPSPLTSTANLARNPSVLYTSNSAMSNSTAAPPSLLGSQQWESAHKWAASDKTQSSLPQSSREPRHTFSTTASDTVHSYNGNNLVQQPSEHLLKMSFPDAHTIARERAQNRADVNLFLQELDRVEAAQVAQNLQLFDHTLANLWNQVYSQKISGKPLALQQTLTKHLRKAFDETRQQHILLTKLTAAKHKLDRLRRFMDEESKLTTQDPADPLQQLKQEVRQTQSEHVTLNQQVRGEQISNLVSLLDITQRHDKLCARLQHSLVRETQVLLKTNPSLKEKKVKEVLESFQEANRDLDMKLSRPVELKISEQDSHYLELLLQKLDQLQETEWKNRNSLR